MGRTWQEVKGDTVKETSACISIWLPFLGVTEPWQASKDWTGGAEWMGHQVGDDEITYISSVSTSMPSTCTLANLVVWLEEVWGSSFEVGYAVVGVIAVISHWGLIIASSGMCSAPDCTFLSRCGHLMGGSRSWLLSERSRSASTYKSNLESLISSMSNASLRKLSMLVIEGAKVAVW